VTKAASGPRTAEDLKRGQARLLATLARTGNISAAHKAGRFTRQDVVNLKRMDAAFSEAYEEALEHAADRLEAEAWRRALEGVAHPVVAAGKPVVDPRTGETLTIRRYSDQLLVLLLKGSKPEKYSSRATHSTTDESATIIKEIAADEDPPYVAAQR
jgi:hypothetical protein